jgi:ABC-type sugar transport system permease subunit
LATKNAPSSLLSGKLRRFSLKRIGNSELASAWLLMLPSLIIIFGLIGYPIIKAIWMSFFQMKLTRANLNSFIFLDNYKIILSDKYFWASIKRTFFFMVVSLFFEFSIGIAVAQLLNTKFFGKGFLTTIVIIPWAIPITVNAIMWRWIFNPSYGAWNALLLQLHLIDSYRSWLSTPTSAMTVLIACYVWKVFPLVAILTLAAMQTIPDALYEAAIVDGASKWHCFWKITLPLIMPSLMVTLILKTVDAFKVFDLIYIMTSGGPMDSTKTIAFFSYLETFKYMDFGKGAAIAVIMTIIIGIFAVFYYKTLNSDAYGQRKNN